MATSTLIKKHLVRPFLKDDKGNWVQVKKATEFTRSMNPVTEERNYIADEHPTTEITDYKPSETFSITTYKGEDDFELFYALYKARAIGDDAKRQFLLVYLADGNSTDGYFAEQTECTVTVDEFNPSSSSLSITVYENGTSTQGTATIDSDGNPVFTAAE